MIPFLWHSFPLPGSCELKVPVLNTDDFQRFLQAAVENMEHGRDFIFVMSGKVRSNEAVDQTS